MDAIVEMKGRNSIYKYCLQKIGFKNELDDKSEAQFVSCAENVYLRIPSFFKKVEMPHQEEMEFLETFVPAYKLLPEN